MSPYPSWIAPSGPQAPTVPQRPSGGTYPSWLAPTAPYRQEKEDKEGRSWGETALRILPVVGGALDLYDMYQEGLWRQFKDHFFLTTFRVLGNSLDLIPLLGARQAYKAASLLAKSDKFDGTKEFLHHMVLGTSPNIFKGTYVSRAERNLYRQTAIATREIDQITNMGADTARLQADMTDDAIKTAYLRGDLDYIDEMDRLSGDFVPERLPGDPLRTTPATRKDPETGFLEPERFDQKTKTNIPRIWRSLKRDPEKARSEELGQYAYFHTRDGRGGVAIITKVEGQPGAYSGAMVVGSARLEMGTYKSIEDVKNIMAALPTSKEVRDHVVEQAAKIRAGHTIAPLSDEGEGIITAARNALPAPGKSIKPLQEAFTADEIKKFTTNPLYEDHFKLENIGSLMRSIERTEPIGTRIARTHIRDYRIELNEWMDSMLTKDVFSGWLKKSGRLIVVANAKLDKEIRNILLHREAVADVRFKAEELRGLHSDLVPDVHLAKALEESEGNVREAERKLGELLQNSSDRSVAISDELREMYYQIGIELKASVPELRDMVLRKEYFTHMLLDDSLKEGHPLYEFAKMLQRNKGAADLQNAIRPGQSFFRFFKRTSKTTKPDQYVPTAWESVSGYYGAAIRVKHTSPALRRIDEILKVLRQTAETGLRQPETGIPVEKLDKAEYARYQKRVGALEEIRFVLSGKGGRPEDVFDGYIRGVINTLYQSGAYNQVMYRMGRRTIATGAPGSAVPGSGKAAPVPGFREPGQAVVHELTHEQMIYGAQVISRRLYQGLLFGRLPTALTQFTQFINTASDVGGRATLRGISVLAREATKGEALGAGVRGATDAPSLIGAAGFGALGFLFLGPVGAAVAAAVTPTARFVSSAIKTTLPTHVAERIGWTQSSRLLRGPEYLNTQKKVGAVLEEIGFSALDMAETILRGATFMAGLDAAKLLNYDSAKGLDFALDLVDGTQFTYDQLARHPWFRHSMIGVVAAPLTSYPLKQIGFLKRLINEGAQDGAPPMTAMARYLFYNGLVATMLREGSKALTGEELTPRALLPRIEPALLRGILPYGVDAPEGFESIASTSLTRAPGPQVLKSMQRLMEGDSDVAEFMDGFIKSFVPFGLVVSDLHRASLRIESDEIRQREGLAATGARLGMRDGQWAVTSKGALGGMVRRTTPIKEYTRIFGLVSAQEAQEMEQERQARDFADNYSNSEVIQEYERIMRNPALDTEGKMMATRELSMTDEGRRKMALGGIRVSEINNLDFSRLKRSFSDLNVPFRNLIRRAVGGDTRALSRAVSMGMTKTEFDFWKRVYVRLVREEQANART